MNERCPRCLKKLDRSKTSRPPYVVLRCRECRKFAVEIEGVSLEWIDGGPDLARRLERSIREGEATKAIVESDEDDPRWEGPGWELTS